MFLKRKLFFKNGNILKYAETSWQTRGKPLPLTAGPESLEDYFQKGAFLTQKAALNLWYVDTRPNSKEMFPNI